MTKVGAIGHQSDTMKEISIAIEYVDFNVLNAVEKVYSLIITNKEFFHDKQIMSICQNYESIFISLVDKNNPEDIYDVYLNSDGSWTKSFPREFCERVYDCDIFDYLENDGSIVYISEQEEDNIINYIKESRLDEIENQQGLNKFREYNQLKCGSIQRRIVQLYVKKIEQPN